MRRDPKKLRRHVFNVPIFLPFIGTFSTCRFSLSHRLVENVPPQPAVSPFFGVYRLHDPAVDVAKHVEVDGVIDGITVHLD